uniref:Signal recognition particle 14 kDa protein n=1 Tax=Spongospora subterranea TaxID=70186 RepID=A0A0H5R834_9EUKA|eukprot:CRZ09986.1 hypothetical protein [Spongospora subterranea]
MVILEGDQFLVRLTRMFEKSRNNNGPNTIRITMKRYIPPSKSSEMTDGDQNSSNAPHCIVKVKVGKLRASVMVPFDEHVRFQTNIAHLFRAYFDGLKKKSKTQDKARIKKEA